MGTQSEQLERETRQIRQQLAATIENLRTRLTPGQVIDEVANYANNAADDAAVEFFRNLGREIRENPLPLALIGIGVAWLIIASSRSAHYRAELSAARKAAEISAPTSAEIAVASSAPVISEPESRQISWQDAPAMEHADEHR